MACLLGVLLALAQAAMADVAVTAGGQPLAGRPAAVVGSEGVVEMQQSDWIAEPFDTVLFQGLCGDPSVGVQAARQDASGVWGPWVAARLRRFPGGRCWGKVIFRDARAGRLRLRAGPAPAGLTLEIYSVETFDSSRGEDAAARPRAAPAPDDEAKAPEVVERAAWGAKPPKEDYAPLVPVRFTQHHTAGKRTVALEDSLAEMRFIQDYHQNGRGWIDIGYHFVVDGAGRIFRGRPENAQGAHTLGQNAGNIGISVMGNYHPPYNDALTSEQRQAIERLGVWLRDRYGVSPDTYKAHRDDNPRTECPGDGIYALLPAIAEAIRAAPLPLAAAARRVRRSLSVDRETTSDQRRIQIPRIASPAITR